MQSDKKYLLLDSCVIQDAGDKNKSKSEALLALLKELDKEYRLAISEISIYENLQGLWGKKAVQASTVFKSYEYKEVNRDVLALASMIGGLYKSETSRNIETGDKIIAATSILTGGFIMTRDYNDFPAPFFKENKWHPVSFKINNHTRTTDYIIYEPDNAIISRLVAEKESKNL